MYQLEHWTSAGGEQVCLPHQAAENNQMLLLGLQHAGAAEQSILPTCFSRYFPNFMVAIRCGQNCCCCCGGTRSAGSCDGRGIAPEVLSEARKNFNVQNQS
jgi:hypothetical protein